MRAQKAKRNVRRKARADGFDVSLLPDGVQQLFGRRVYTAELETVMLAWKAFNAGMGEGMNQVAAMHAVPQGAIDQRGAAPIPPRPQWQPKGDNVPPEQQGDGEGFDDAPATDDPLAEFEKGYDGAPEYGPIGHYSPTEIKPYVDFAIEVATSREVGVKVARDLIADCERNCRYIPESMDRQIAQRLTKLNARRDGDNDRAYEAVGD